MSRLSKLSIGISILGLFCMPMAATSQTPASNDPPDTAEERASQRESLSLLRQERFAGLDAKMNGLQRSYERGQINDERLLHEFRAFYDTASDLAPHYDAWIAKMPDSYAAWLSRGIYYRYLGLEARGTRYVSETPRQQLEVMSAYLGKAMRDYEKSLNMTKSPVLSYHCMLGVAMLEGDDDLARRMLDASIRVDPTNFIVRYKYLATLQTRWGGSLDQMIAFEQQARAAGLSEIQLKYFANMIAKERKWLQQNER